MHRVGTRALAGGDEFRNVQIGLRRCAAVQCDRAIGFAHKGRVGIAVGIDRNGFDAHALRGANDAPCDLAAIGDQ